MVLAIIAEKVIFRRFIGARPLIIMDLRLGLVVIPIVFWAKDPENCSTILYSSGNFSIVGACESGSANSNSGSSLLKLCNKNEALFARLRYEGEILLAVICPSASFLGFPFGHAWRMQGQPSQAEPR